MSCIKLLISIDNAESIRLFSVHVIDCLRSENFFIHDSKNVARENFAFGARSKIFTRQNEKNLAPLLPKNMSRRCARTRVEKVDVGTKRRRGEPRISDKTTHRIPSENINVGSV
ncbi:hypothetical protein HMPREF1989_00678 [Porphyromonas gingivalis F0566]|nr:hypothetical protein HMPREF1989_00678 [Porphyromonas gingivalis F0566]